MGVALNKYSVYTHTF